MKTIRENELSPEAPVNIIIEDSDIGKITNGFVIRTNHKIVMDCIESAEKKTSAKRIETLLNVRNAIVVGNAFFDRPENQKMVGNCQAWNELIDDCVRYMCYDLVQNGSLLKLISDEELNKIATNQEGKYVEPTLHYVM